jgi:serine/threonine-protein kinase
MDIGSRLGKYQILSQIGTGGMGSVYRARDSVLDREVAIKVIAPSFGFADLKSRLFAEAKASARLDHPNILPVFDFGEENGIAFIVMPFVHGHTLEHMMSRLPGPLSLGTAQTILEQVASALDFAHAQGIVHRDVKPANIMVEANTNRAILMDFGIARMRASDNRLTQTGATIGTINYMSPEQILGQDTGPASDQYSLGLIAFEMLTGRLPFAGDSDYEVMSAHMQKVPPLVREFRPDIPEPVTLAIARALAKKPDDRFPNAREFVEAAFGSPRPDALAAPAAGRIKRILERIFKGKPDSDQPKPVLSTPRISQSSTVVPAPPQPAPISGLPEAPSPADATVLQPVLLKRAPTVIPSAPTLAGDRTQVFQIPGGGLGAGAGSPVEERPRVRLVFKTSANPLQIGKSVEVNTVPFRIGRAPDAHLLLSGDEGISRNHAAIEWINGQYVVRDIGSTNGTYVQGRRVTDKPEPVRFGATIRLSAATELMLVAEEDTSIPDWTGAVLDGRYTLEKLLRTSGKAALYEAADARLPHKVAIKILSPVLARYPGYLDDFQQEARLAAELQHPHILRVLDSGVAQLAPPFSATCHYVCLEMMAEGSLAGKLRAQNTLPLDEVIGIVDGVSDALEYAHTQGVIHRGLKPSSLLFGHNGFVFVKRFRVRGTIGQPGKRHASGRSRLPGPRAMGARRGDRSRRPIFAGGFDLSDAGRIAAISGATGSGLPSRQLFARPGSRS